MEPDPQKGSVDLQTAASPPTYWMNPSFRVDQILFITNIASESILDEHL
jgi:hypothetical protein